MPIWYLKCPKNYEDRRTGPGIFFGGPKLPKKPPEQDKSTGRRARPQGRAHPPSRAGMWGGHARLPEVGAPASLRWVRPPSRADTLEGRHDRPL
ncbi:hypothetical protein JCGZ_27040 [Jatropha curcas]|uniref:Uncharacterized protein n=1 Tax=Jatropha curcas TaxID=180498 RepID=A0A067JJE6_JATCU|nr:hypothetical protein JCGZ_27040 [Jatropha curcas]